MEKNQKNKVNKVETQNQTKDGEILPVQVTSKYLKYEDKKYEFAFVQDITERKENERELKTTKERFQRIIESVDAVLWEYNFIEGKYEYTSPQVEDLLDYPPEEWSGLDF